MTDTFESGSDAAEQARKEHQKGYLINRRRLLQGIGAGGAAAVGFGAGGDAVPQQLQAVDDAQAFGPIAPAAAVVFAYVSVSETQGSYDPRDWFSESSETIDKEVTETQKTLQEATHQNAIESQGTNTQFLDNYQNDLRFIEAKVEQLIDQKVIGNFDSYTSESGVTNDAETVTSNHLEKTINTVLETYNYNGLNARQIMANLDEAGFSQNYGVAKKVTVESESDLEAFNTSYSGGPYEIETPAIIDLQTDLSISTSDPYGINIAAPTVIYGNGHSMSTSASNGFSVGGNGDPMAHFDNVQFDSNVVVNGSPANFVNGTTATIDGSTGSATDVYVDSSSSVTAGLATIVDSEFAVNAYKSNVTLDPTDIGASVTTTGVTNKAEETVSLPAVDKTLDSSYYSGSNPARLAVPYDLDAGAFVDQTSSSLVVQTTTSGNSKYAEILPMVEYDSIISTRDSLSGQAYTSAQSYASSLWTDYVSQNNSVGDLTDEERADFASLVRDINKEDPRSILQSYVTAYDGLMKPYTTEVEVTGVSSGDVYTGALFSTDLANLIPSGSLAVGDVLDVDGGSNSETFTSVTAGEVITVANKPINTITSATNGSGTDVSADVNIVSSEDGTVEYVGSSTIDLTLGYDYGVSRTFVVDPDAEKATQDLTGEDYEVTSITQGDSSVNSVDIRTYEFKDTDLTESANALDDLDVTISRTDGSGSDGGALFGDSLPMWAKLGGAGALAYGVIRALFNSGDGGRGGRGGQGRFE